MGMSGGFIWFVFAIAIGIWASNRGRSGFGWFLLAVVISPLLAGVLLVVTKNRAGDDVISTLPSEKTHVRCPQCAEFVLPEAKKCKHCGAELNPDETLRQRVAENAKRQTSEDLKNLLIGIAFITGLVLFVKFLTSLSY
jgi:DNA-directed RNA polymerase subunit RPC12/RpoP